MKHSGNFEHLIEKYAEVALKIGINVQQGQDLIIDAPVSAAAFVHKLVDKAYDEGAKSVYVDYKDEQLTRLNCMKQPEQGLKEFPMWKVKGFVEMAENNVAYLQVYTPNPNLLKDADPERVAIVNKTAATSLREFKRFVMDHKISWSMVSIPTKGWAEAVFPKLTEAERETKLWELIFDVTRVTRENPVEAWEEHIRQLKEKADYLTGKQYKKLHYRSAKTDLTIELPHNHVWISANAENDAGTSFIPNIPTEEIFTVPVRTGVNGVVGSTKPLNYNGLLIEDFSLTFKDGEVVDFSAASGYETLKKLLETDEGARRLGEVALVPHNSPISNSEVLFYNTLYDENASCHLALGFSIPVGVKGGTGMNSEERKQHGLNESLLHVDFMIGSADLNIDGERVDGEKQPVLRNGNWAF